MFPQDPYTWTLYIALAVALSVVSSALWESIFKPLVQMTTRTILKLATFGMISTRNSMYKELATRPIQKPTFILVSMIVMASYFASGYSISSVQLAYFPSPTVSDNELKSILASPDEENRTEKLELLSSKLDTEIKTLKKKSALTMLMLSLVITIFYTFKNSKSKYIASATNYFDQLLAICAPHISDQINKELLSAFALIRTKEDYQILISKLKTIAKENNILELPYFSIF